MDTDRQDEVDSPMIEDFLDCDQLISDSDGGSSGSSSPRRSFKRLHIHVDMTNTQYLAPGAHHTEQSRMDGLPICTSGPSTSAFSSAADLDPYSAVSGVSSFNYPAAADPSLLTPASSSGSPPLQHKQSGKPMRTYHHSQAPALAPQAPTPPDTSKMYNYNGYELNSSSQSPSPMTVNPTVTEAAPFMTPYMAHSPPVSHHTSSPKSEIPPPIDPYLGHFTVSGGNDGDVTHHSLQDYHPYGVEVAQPGAYLTQQHVPVGTPHMHHRMPSNGSAPVLSQPHPSHYRPHSGGQVGAIEDLRDPAMLLGPYPPHGAMSPGRRMPPRKKPSNSRKPSRTSKAIPHAESSANRQFRPEDDGEELTLKDDAPEDDKYLFQLRKEFISEKGKGMWEEMKARYSEKHQGNWEKAALQMKVSRAVARYGVWPEREIDRLKEAFDYFEEMRYQLIIARMKETGGCRVWDWKKPHIVAMLVKLGLEEPTVNEKTGTRRRRKAAKRQGGPQNGGHPVMGDWSGGLGLHHPVYHGHGHAHHVAAAAAARQGQPYDTMMDDDFGGAPNLTAKEQDDLINDVFSNVKPERSLSPDDGMDGLAYGNGTDGGARRPSMAAPREFNHQGSARVARQACDQLLQHPSS
ncbi:hypothetical protein CHGG_01733 [Chaetomium globosum CBS 148.51]|uniref:Uncharacterized protein n=1 Tax=Chaetomium globosum (strain ATCC 6205 / CBS 148.51 / DSM 1962 / NBRC 6347 / NRRL 1970) TaxID=306901 RepID=Q2HDH1_CHAGB|nr:uncharacterized protein CHGG_01733 [Chaetomium globosum CBS 148.51]EAQ93498.1 hypothetical protein CHGG_01733 [Chaetomium globosum CBS 148.51]